MVRNMKNNKKTWLGAMFSFALVAIMGLTFAFKPANLSKTEKAKRVNYYFRFTGSPSEEADRTLWENVPSTDPACGGTNDGCLIAVDESYTTISGTDRILTTDVPVTSGSHQNPVLGDMVKASFNKN